MTNQAKIPASDPAPKIARVLSSTEVILNKGTDAGVEVGQIYGILDGRTSDIQDPDSGEPLGDFPRYLARVEIRSVQKLMSYATYYSPSLASTTFMELVGGARTSRKEREWPEAVSVGDQLRLVGG